MECDATHVRELSWPMVSGMVPFRLLKSSNKALQRV